MGNFHVFDRQIKLDNEIMNDEIGGFRYEQVSKAIDVDNDLI